MQPKVSVLIPTFNSALYLDEAIQSVLAQTYSNFELIIVDNASTDNTQSLVAKYLTDSRVSYHRNNENIGMANNWNKCLRLANGTYIKYLMSDDKFHPQILEKFVSIMERYPNVTLVTSDRALFGKNEPTRYFKTPMRKLQTGSTVINETLDTWNWIGEPTSVMFRRSNLNLGEFNPTFKYYLDWDMWLRHLTAGDCYFIPEVLSYFRIHEGQESNQLKNNYYLFIEEYLFYKNLKKHKPYNIKETGFDPSEHVKIKSFKLFKIGLQLFAKGKYTKWRIASKALKLGWRDALIPDIRKVPLVFKSRISKLPASNI